MMSDGSGAECSMISETFFLLTSLRTRHQPYSSRQMWTYHVLCDVAYMFRTPSTKTMTFHDQVVGVKDGHVAVVKQRVRSDDCVGRMVVCF